MYLIILVSTLLTSLISCATMFQTLYRKGENVRDLDFLNYEIKITFESQLINLNDIKDARENSLNLISRFFKNKDMDGEVLVSSYFRENHQVLYVFFDNVSVNNVVEKELLINAVLSNTSKFGIIKDVSINISQHSCPPDIFTKHIPIPNSDAFLLLKTPSGNVFLYFEGKLKATNDRALRMCYAFLMNENMQPHYGILSIDPNIEDKEELAKISDIKSISGYFEVI
jgi:hypothetical protein